MNKLNRKGFTLIELLAVVVILAVILVVTIPNVLDTMATARQKSLDDVAAIMQDYVQKQYDQCELQLAYDEKILQINTTGHCEMKSDYSNDLITNSGYNSSDIASVTVSISGNKVSVTNVTSTPAGKFQGLISPKASTGPDSGGTK